MTALRYTFCPSAPNVDSVPRQKGLTALYKSVGRLLGGLGFILGSRAEADLVVLIPRIDDRLVWEDVRLLRARCSPGAKVLVIDTHRRLACFPGRLPPGVHVIHLYADWEAPLRKFLAGWSHEEEPPSNPEPSCIQLGTIRDELLASVIGAATDENHDAKLWDRVITLVEGSTSIGANTTPALLRSNDELDFLYGLIRTSSKNGRIEHDLNRANEVMLSEVMSDSGKFDDLGRTELVRRFANASADILQCLRHPTPSPGDRNVVLLIDDRAELVAESLQRIIDAFMPGYDLRIWNPTRAARDTKDSWPEIPLNVLQRYSALDSGTASGNHWPVVVTDVADKRYPFEKFMDLVGKCAFVLVDLLFEMPGDCEEEAGCNVIRGLFRVMRDQASGDAGAPHILAISRAGDQEKVNAALRAGASGYILKDRLLSFPGTAARLLAPVHESNSTFHGNFRALHSLPPETIGLLKAATIPCINFREGLNAPLSRRQNATAQLLRDLPKTDLHVHVGSLMQPEFLAVAAAIMLLRHDKKAAARILTVIRTLGDFFSSGGQLHLHPNAGVGDLEEPYRLTYWPDRKNGVRELANQVKQILCAEIVCGEDNLARGGADAQIRRRYNLFRSFLHRALNIRDHISGDAAKSDIRKKPDISMVQFALAHAAVEGQGGFEWLFEGGPGDVADVLRIFILHLAQRQGLTIQIRNSPNLRNIDVFGWFRSPDGPTQQALLDDWDAFHKLFYSDNLENGRLSVRGMRGSGWACPNSKQAFVTVKYTSDPRLDSRQPMSRRPEFEDAPLPWLLASGTHSTSLEEYLEGCEYSGAEHLRHPYLFHLYAQHVVHQFADLGVVYAELRAAAAGYSNQKIDFSFADACGCLTKAFSDAQSIWWKHNPSGTENDPRWLWTSRFALPNADEGPVTGVARRPLPVKVGIILTGKRHKPTREMLREAAAAVVLHVQPQQEPISPGDFFEREFEACRLVGFDLAGKEEGFPPERFRAEFELLARLHIPITAHAGENATAEYIQNAVLDLRARRLGHGLALPEDPQLLARVREDGVCIELCPVSNFQTSRFVPAKRHGGRREYPLRRFLENGNVVCINTDNPIISDTNIVKEYFQASYGYGGDGLSLWEALRLMRMGFVHAFMSMPERRSALELADQFLFDYFSQESVVVLLRELAAASKSRSD